MTAKMSEKETREDLEKVLELFLGILTKLTIMTKKI